MSSIDTKIKELHQKAQELLKDKKSEVDIINELTKLGIEPGYAELILENVKNDIFSKKEFWKHIIFGSFVTIAGLLINYLSYWFAVTRGTALYLEFWGIVVVGIIVLLRGIILFKP